MKRLLVCSIAGLLGMFGLLALAGPAGAVDFGQPTGSPFTMTGGDPSDIASGDLNGDGRDDVVTTNWDVASFSAMLATAAGGMTNSAQGLVATNGYPNGVALADFNGDDDLDAAVVAPVSGGSGSTVEIHEGLGDGTFDATPSYLSSTGGNASAVVADDLNNDGDMDMAITSDTTDHVTVFTGDGTGGMSFELDTFHVGSQPRAIVAGDLNGDGFADLATSNSGSFFDDAISVLFSTGGTSFAPAVGVEGDYQPYGLVTGNFDSGTSLDLAQVNSPNSALTVKLNDGAGAFTSAPNLPSIPSHWGNAMGSADFNADGRDDLAATWTTSISGEQDDQIGVFLSGADGTMTADPDGPFPTDPSTYPWDLVTGDFNGDGKPDFATTDIGTKLSVFINGLVPAPVITVDPASHDFGSRAAGTGASAAEEFVVTNTGSADAEFTDIGLIGGFADEFLITDDGCSAEPLPAGEFCEISIVFDPGSVGAKAATLSVESNAPTATSALTGTGAANPGISVNPASHDFGDVTVGEGPEDQTFTMTNTGTTPLNVSGFQIVNSDEFVVSDTAGCGEPLAPEGTCSVTVSFAPDSVGNKSTLLTIHSNASSSPTDVALSGAGLSNPDFELAPVDHSFGTGTVGDGPTPPIEFTLTSTGATGLEVGPVALAGANPADYAITSDDCSDNEIAPDADCVVSVAFDPKQAGPSAAELRFDLGSEIGPAVAVLTGEGQNKVVPPPPPPPPPTPCEPVTVKNIKSYRPRVDAKPNALGVRARFVTDRDASVRVAATVKFRFKGKSHSFKVPQKKILVTGGEANYKAAVPKAWRSKLKPLKKVTLVLRYSSRGDMPTCTGFGPTRTKSLKTQVVWIIRG